MIKSLKGIQRLTRDSLYPKVGQSVRRIIKEATVLVTIYRNFSAQKKLS
jgi:hypothetical protein